MGNIKKGAPGPGAYDYKSTRSNIAYSIHARTNIYGKVYLLNSFNIFCSIATSSNLKVPGPGQYDNVSSITTNGKFFLSKYKDSKAPVINPARSERFNKTPSKGLLFSYLLFIYCFIIILLSIFNIF